MDKYTVLIIIGCLIDVIFYGVNYFITPVAVPVLSIASIIGTVLILIGAFLRNKNLKK